MRERTRLGTAVDAVRMLERERADALELAEMAEMDGDAGVGDEAADMLRTLKERAGRAELEALLSGEADGNDCYVEINSGAGGTESADWALMLMRMYTRWSNAHGMTVDVIEETGGETACRQADDAALSRRRVQLGNCHRRRHGLCPAP